MNVFDQIAEPHRSVIMEVLAEKAPALLADLSTKQEPDPGNWRAVTNTLADAAGEHWLPDRYYEMDERGLAIDFAMGAFINAFMYVKDRERERDSPPGSPA